MEDYELAIKLARELRKDDTWCPYDSYTSLELTDTDVPKLIMSYSENKGQSRHDNHYIWVYRKDEWVFIGS